MRRPSVHVLVLVVVTAALAFPNLGATSLWDDDEGVNAECTREMMEAGTWIVPTFNWDLRTAKPVLLNWLMRGSFAAFGVTEWAARLPSALMAFVIVLLTYDLGRRLFGATTGFLAGLIAASALGLVYLTHAVTTDATLIAATVFYFWAFHRGTADGGRGWFIPCGVASALATLAKGPAVGLILPSAVVFGYFLWTRGLWRLFDRRLLWGVLAWVLVAGPWYTLVATETKGEWPRAFFLNENLNRAAEPMENHRGVPVLYELAVLAVLFAPWSGFVAAAVWFLFVLPRHGGERASPLPSVSRLTTDGSRLLLLWVGVYFAACAAAATKLPHYIAPVYPALALLVARFLVRWVNRDVTVPAWVILGGVLSVALTGVVVGVGLLAGEGWLAEQFPKVRAFPGLAKWAWIGLIPLAGAGLMEHFRRRDHRPGVVLSLAASTVAFVGLLAAFPILEVDARKAAKALVAESGARQVDREVRVGSTHYCPSVVFYVGRRVEWLRDPDAAAEFLSLPVESYLFVTEPVWEQVRPLAGGGWRVAARRYDYYRHCDVLVITNR